LKLLNLGDLEKQPVSHTPDIFKKVMIKKGEVLNLTQFAQVVLEKGQIADAHSHQDMYEIFYIEEGEGEILINGEGNSVKKGSCVVVEPGEEHEVKNTSEGKLILLVIGLEVRSEI
jgi:quercetin dioxygenase-like cupin family protein